RRQRVRREISRSGADQRVLAQGVDQQVFRVHEENVSLLARQFLLEEPSVEGEDLYLARGDDLAFLHAKCRAEDCAVGNHEVAVERLSRGGGRWLLLQDETKEVALAAERFDEVIGNRERSGEHD